MIQPKGKKEKKIMDGKDLADYWASLVVQDPPAIQETQIQSPDQEDPLEKGMTAHSSILA